MSIRLMTACWPLQLPSTQKFVLITLADQANDDGVCWPSIKHISERTGLADRTVRYAIEELRKAGLLRVTDRMGQASVFVITPAPNAEVPRQEVPTPPRHVVPVPRHVVPTTPAPGAGTPAPRADRTLNNPNRTLKNQEADAVAPPLPEWVPETEWTAFVDMRRAMKAPLTAHAQRIALSKLDDLRRQGYPPADILNESVLHGWRGLFKPKTEQRAQHGKQRFDLNASARAAEAHALGSLGVPAADTHGGDIRAPLLVALPD